MRENIRTHQSILRFIPEINDNNQLKVELLRDVYNNYFSFCLKYRIVALQRRRFLDEIIKLGFDIGINRNKCHTVCWHAELDVNLLRHEKTIKLICESLGLSRTSVENRIYGIVYFSDEEYSKLSKDGII